MSAPILHFTAEELGTEIQDLMRKVGCHFGPDMIRKIVREMDASVREDRMEKERKRWKGMDSEFNYLLEENRKAILGAYALTPDQLARAQGFFPRVNTEDSPKPKLFSFGSQIPKERTDCPACDAGIPAKPAPKRTSVKELVRQINEKLGTDFREDQVQITVHRDPLKRKTEEIFNAPKFLPMSTMRTLAEQDDLVGAIVRARLPDIDVDQKPAGGCECGAHKTSGAKKGDPTHSSWCPWSKS
jgi:hypothetical protein